MEIRCKDTKVSVKIGKIWRKVSFFLGKVILLFCKNKLLTIKKFVMDIILEYRVMNQGTLLQKKCKNKKRIYYRCCYTESFY